MKREVQRPGGDTLTIESEGELDPPRQRALILKAASGTVTLAPKEIEHLKASIYQHENESGDTSHLRHVALIANGIPVLEFRINGDVFVRGEKVDSNKELYKAFHEWMTKANVHTEEPRDAPPPIGSPSFTAPTAYRK